MRKLINWFRNEVNRQYFVMGGNSYKRYEGWNWGKISFLLILMIIILSIIFIR